MKPHEWAAGLTRREWLRSTAALGAGAALSGLPFAGRAFAQGASEWPAVSRFIRDYVDSRKVPNMVAALGWGQAAPQIVAYGKDSFIGERLSDSDSLYRIYSMTKPITGMAAMMLIDEGKLGLDQPIAEILPRFARMQVQKVYDGPITPDNLEPAVRPITVRHLLTHTGGISYGVQQTGPIAEVLRTRGLVPGLVSRLDVPGAFRGTPAPSLEAFADGLAEMPLVYQPGTRWSYSAGADLMGRIIEVVSGIPFDMFLQQRFIDPLGMTSTGFQVPESEKHRLTTNYFLFAGRPVPIDLPENSVFLDKPPFPFGGAGLVSTARDYDRFLKMLAGYGAIEGKRVMSEAAVRLGTSNLFPDTLSPDDDYAKTYDYGAFGRLGRGKEAGIYGWFGAAGTCGLVDMNSGLRHSLMTQYMPGMGYPVYGEFPAAVAQDVAAHLAAR